MEDAFVAPFFFSGLRGKSMPIDLTEIYGDGMVTEDWKEQGELRCD